MDEETFNRMLDSIRASVIRYPKCRVASCDCDDSIGEWIPGCNCPGHWQQIEKELGEGWTLADAAASAEVGRPVRAAAT